METQPSSSIKTTNSFETIITSLFITSTTITQVPSPAKHPTSSKHPPFLHNIWNSKVVLWIFRVMKGKGPKPNLASIHY
jgi:hypothetical protein